jgi:anti-sigma factor RsiW
MRRCAEVVPLLGPLLDGALAHDDRAWVLDHVSGCASCRDRCALIAAQGQALREALSARVDRIDLGALAGRVMASVRDARPPALSRTPVWTREMWWAHRGAIGATSGLALAACMALAVFFSPTRTDEVGLLADNSPQVEEVEFGTRDGAILQLPQQTTVIWMSDDRGVPQ